MVTGRPSGGLACSHSVRFSRSSHVSLGLAVPHLELEQLHHLEQVRRQAVRANDRSGRAGLATEVGWSADVGAVDVEIVEHT